MVSAPQEDLDKFREADIPTVSGEEFDEALENLDERRRRLLAVVYADAWNWPSMKNE